MKVLTKNEIKFVNDTKFTPSIYQCGDYDRTIFKNYMEARKTANKYYGFDLDVFIEKNLDQEDFDSISLEYVATYLLYTFFSKEDLMSMSPETGLKWLQDYRYWLGFRQWDIEFVATEISEALEVYNGLREFYITAEGQVWNREVL